MAKKSFKERRFKKPDWQITARIAGVKLGTTGETEWNIDIEGEADLETAAGILERAAEVLRIKKRKHESQS